MLRTMRRSLPLAAVLVFSACGPKVLHVDDLARPARTPAEVQLLLDVPDRPYRTVALIRSGEVNLFSSMEARKQQVREEAAALGADAVILSLMSHTGTETVTSTDSEGQVSVGTATSDDVRIFGRAIIFVSEAAPE